MLDIKDIHGQKISSLESTEQNICSRFQNGCHWSLIFKSYGRRAAGRGYLYFHLYMCVSVALSLPLWLCVIPSSQMKKRYKPEFRHTYSSRSYIKMFFFSKKWPWALGSLTLKKYTVTWILCISPRLRC